MIHLPISSYFQRSDDVSLTNEEDERKLLQLEAQCERLKLQLVEFNGKKANDALYILSILHVYSYDALSHELSLSRFLFFKVFLFIYLFVSKVSIQTNQEGREADRCPYLGLPF